MGVGAHLSQTQSEVWPGCASLPVYMEGLNILQKQQSKCIKTLKHGGMPHKTISTNAIPAAPTGRTSNAQSLSVQAGSRGGWPQRCEARSSSGHHAGRKAIQPPGALQINSSLKLQGLRKQNENPSGFRAHSFRGMWAITSDFRSWHGEQASVGSSCQPWAMECRECAHKSDVGGPRTHSKAAPCKFNVACLL